MSRQSLLLGLGVFATTILVQGQLASLPMPDRGCALVSEPRDLRGSAQQLDLMRVDLARETAASSPLRRDEWHFGLSAMIVAAVAMVMWMAHRERALADLNRHLERRVEERTAELSRQHDLQKLILENLADGVVVTDALGHVLLWNDRATELIGCEARDCPIERWPARFGIYRDESGELLPAAELPLTLAMRGVPTDHMSLYLRHPGRASGFWTQVTARPLRDPSGEITGAVAIIVDVTEKRRLHDRIHTHRKKLVELGHLMLGSEIASMTAHQLGQPLAAISNYTAAATQMHRQGKLTDDELGSLLSRIERLSDDCGVILSRLRERIRRREPVHLPFDVNETVASCIDSLKGRISNQAVRVESCYCASLPPTVGDPIALEHALAQLVSNALDAMEQMPKHQRRLGVRTEYDKTSATIIIEIRDTGSGIDAAIADRVFEAWETSKPGALGIGLSIAKTIVSEFDGRLCATPAGDGGSIFRVDLPATPGARQ